MHRLPRPRHAALLLAAMTVCYPLQTPAAAPPTVHILAPASGATLQARDQNVLRYAVDDAQQGEYVHVIIDGVEVGIMHPSKGTYTMETLAPGHHRICVAVVSRTHRPLGTRKCVSVDVR
ncbi:MAG: Ig-like domain-containing protein [Gammaproteobacteria bacterium]